MRWTIGRASSSPRLWPNIASYPASVWKLEPVSRQHGLRHPRRRLLSAWHTVVLGDLVLHQQDGATLAPAGGLLAIPVNRPVHQGVYSIPEAPETERQAIAELARTCSALGYERYQGQVNFQRRLFQTFSVGGAGQLNQKAEAWWELSLNQLGDALKQSFKLPANPMKNPRAADEWEPYLQQKRDENARLTRTLNDAEAELNDRVYRLLDLQRG